MSFGPARLAMLFSCLGHAYMHMFTAFYFVIVLSLEDVWTRPYHELIELWTLGALLVGLGALPAGWLADRWSMAGMMVIYYVGLGLSSIACGLLDSPMAMLVGLASLGLFASIYHPVGIAWLVRSAKSRGRALGINGIFGSFGVALAGLVAGALIDLFGWRAAFILPGVISLATGLALAWLISLGRIETSPEDRLIHPPASRGDMLRVFMILVLTMLILGIIFQSTQIALPKVFDLRLRDIAGEGASGIGIIVMLVYGVAGVVQLVGGYLADRYPLKPLYLAMFLFQVPALGMLALFSGLPLIAVATLVALLGTIGLPAENMLLARYTPQRHRSLAFGVKFVLAFGTGPLALEMVSVLQAESGEFVSLFTILAILSGVAALAAMSLPRQARARIVAAE